MLDQRDIEIGGEKFVIGKLPTSDALKYGIILGRIVGSVLAGGLEGRDLGGEEPEEDEEPGEGPEEDEEGKLDFDLADQMDVSKMIEALMVHMDERKVPALIQKLVEKSVALPKYSPEWYETRFAGKLPDLLELLTAIFEDNFGGVIEAGKKKFQGFGQTTGEKSSDISTVGNGSNPTPEEESHPSFFDPSARNIVNSSRRKKNSPSRKSSS